MGTNLNYIIIIYYKIKVLKYNEIFYGGKIYGRGKL